MLTAAASPMTDQNAPDSRTSAAAAVGPQPVLVATDGRETATSAVLAGERAALRLGASPMVFAAIEPEMFYGEMPVTRSVELETERSALRETLREHVERETGSTWPTEVDIGPAGQRIALAATERDASLVVLGIGRHRMVDRLLGAETALHVLRGTERPVLAVGPDADGFFRRVVVAVDFSAASTRAAAIACRLIAPGGTLSLVHVRPSIEWGDEIREPLAAARAREPLQRLAAALRHGTTGCEDCGTDTGRSDVTIGTAILVGEPPAEVLDYAERVGADLVAVGTRGLALVKRLLVGSVATDVIRLTSERLSACSVLACAEPRLPVAEQLIRRLRGAA